MSSSAARHDGTNVAVSGAGAATAASTSRKAKVRLWDLALDIPKATPNCVGISKGSPYRHAASAAALELESAKALRALRRCLDAACQEGGLSDSVRALTFERWRWQSKWEEAESTKSAAAKDGHPVVPNGRGPAAAENLRTELVRQGLSAERAAAAVKALCDESAKQAARLLKLSHQARSGKDLALPQELTLTFNHHNIDLACGRAQVKLSRAAYGKLCILHRRHAPAAESTPGPSLGTVETYEDDTPGEVAERAEVAAAMAEARVEGADASSRHALHQRIFALAMRYKSLQGAGFQAAIGPPVWHVLRSALGVACEGFASPLNAYLPAFGSGFVDVDGPFGSRGSFFGFKPSSGSFELNPPFVHNIMDAAAAHVVALLKAAAEAQGDHALSFTVILPGWKECDAFNVLSESHFLRRRVLVAAADHGFCDGASYQRQDPYRNSPFDTSVFVLQTDKAARKWPANDKFEADLRDAFAACVPSESAVGRQLKHDAGAKGKLTGSSKRKHADGAGDGARKKKVRPSGGQGGQTHDAEIEAELDAWVRAKRKGNFEKADEIRAQLREKGIATEKERPFKRKGKEKAS